MSEDKSKQQRKKKNLDLKQNQLNKLVNPEKASYSARSAGLEATNMQVAIY